MSSSFKTALSNTSNNNYLMKDFSTDPFKEMFEEENLEEENLEEDEKLEEDEELEDKEDYIDFLCDNVNSTYNIDLNNISQSDYTINDIDLSKIKTNYENIKSKYFVPGLIKYKDIQLPIIKYISRGSFGYVYEYSSITPLPENWTEITDKRGTFYKFDDGSNLIEQWDRPRIPGDKYYTVAVKVYMNPTDTEIKKIININNSRKLGSGFCNTVNAIILELNNNIYNKNVVVSVMDMMDGSLNDLPDIHNTRELLEILLKITQMFECMNKLNLVYTDIKPGNILFKCYDGYKLKIALGDLGSICNNGKKEAYTYIPPEFFNGGNNCTEASMVWGLGVLFITLLRVNDKLFYHKTVKKFPNVEYFNSQVKIFVDRLSKEFFLYKVEIAPFSILDGKNDGNIITLIDLLNFMLIPDPMYRITLQQIINILSVY